ncbi:MAG TPA: DUF4097 family beta strand repeat-containing protein [Candidatus Polarisedimenticolia bacterium]|jgi:hypothetical protein
MSLSRTASALCLTASFALAGPVLADSTRTLRLEYAPTGAFVVENLAGTMRVIAGSSDKVVTVATVHADDDATANLMKLEQVSGEGGVPTLRMVYPLDKYTTFRYPAEAGEEEEHWLSRLLGLGNSSSTRYAGYRVTVKSGSGVLLYADVEVQLPRRAVEGTFRNLVGGIHGQGVEGTLVFDGASGDVTLDDLKGTITADTGSGDVKAANLEGSFTCDTGSGDCDLHGFKGDKITCDVGSGDVNLASGSARVIDADTGSGDVEVKDFDTEEFKADTGSGDVLLEVRGNRLASVTADTGSGSVTLRLDPGVAFEAKAAQGSGDIVNRFSDAQPILKDKEVIGYRRGDGKTRINVETGSGDVVIEPRS